MSDSERLFTSPAPSPDARIAYNEGPYQFAELRLPVVQATPVPIVIVIHGGYWLAEYGIDYCTHLCEDLAKQGVATWCIEYRRLGNEGGGWPGTFLDIAKAADHLPTIAAQYNLDLQRVMVMGHSAGGHLALWLASRHRIDKSSVLHCSSPLKVDKVISLSGVNDLKECWEKRLFDDTNVVEHFMAGSPEAVPKRYQSGSPPELLPTGVKQRLFHGDADPFVPLSLSENYYRTAQARGDDVSLVILPGAGHFEVVDPKAKEWPQIVAAIFAD